MKNQALVTVGLEGGRLAPPLHVGGDQAALVTVEIDIAGPIVFYLSWVQVCVGRVTRQC